ncbi:hypothetical protein BpHYR1_033355 [Brachionus plicatilis]|uniref:Uncharacterized protein n=1 Tax=Brachionus plicatilis TaxID=10195 RepID=A0A3M7PFC9_BRAPC|nr:hypothetical protein BpHYR1_033355 [Brachionus plicatilis]
MSNGTVEQKTSNHSDVSLSDLKVSNFASLNSFLIDELEVNLSINLSDDLKNIIKTYLSEYESLNQRKLEEKDSVISQLKQSLLELTEKRFRASIQNGSSSLPYENIEFLINEKEAKINQLLDQLSENERDINKLKQTINSQDDVILSLNNNIYSCHFFDQMCINIKK